MSVVVRTQSLVIFCFRWAARSSVAYFGLRFVLAVPLTMLSSGQVLSWLHVLLLVSLALFTIGSVAVLWSPNVVVSGRRAYEKAFMSGLFFCLTGCGIMYVDWLSRSEIDKPVLLLAYGDVLYVGLVLLALLATSYGVIWLYALV